MSNTNLPSMKQLRYMVAVVEQGHFGRAAAACHVSQSTLSSGINELEQLLGYPLIERTNRQVTITPSAQAFAAEAKQVLLAAEEMMQRVTTGNPLSGKLSLGVIPTVSPYLLPRVLPSLHALYPQLKLSLQEHLSGTLVDNVVSGRLDCALIATPYPTKGLRSAAILSEHFHLALHPSNPLASRSSVSTRDLSFSELLVLAEGHCLSEHALSICDISPEKRSLLFQGTSLFTLLQMVAANQGVTFVPEMALASADIRGIVTRPLSDPGPHRKIVLVWRKSFPDGRSCQKLADHIRTELERP